MHQDKILARILLIFSVANLALAAPAAVRQRHLDVAKAVSQKRGPPGSDNGETGEFPPESSSSMPPHNGATNGWPESSSAAANRITTQAPGAPVWGNGATGNLPPDSSERIPPQDSITNAWLDHTSLPESSPAAANHIATQASGAPVWGSGRTGDLRPELSAPAPLRDHRLSESVWAWLLQPDPPESSSAAGNRITTQAGAPVRGNEATGDLRPELSTSVPPVVPLAPHSSPTDEWAWLGDVTHVSSPLERPSVPPPDQAMGTTASSSSDSTQWAHPEDPSPPSPELPAAPEADRFFGGALTHKILFYSGVAGVIGGTAALAYGIHKWTKHPYVSPLSCGHLAESQTF